MATTYPLDDGDMYYDLDLRTYVLTVGAFNQYVGVNLVSEIESETKAKSFLEECSEDVKEFIYSYSLQNTVPYKMYKIAKDSNIRNEYKRALLAQARYAFRSSSNLLKDQHGINLEKSKVVDLKSLRGDIGISHITKNILGRIGLLNVGKVIHSNIIDDGTW